MQTEGLQHGTVFDLPSRSSGWCKNAICITTAVKWI